MTTSPLSAGWSLEMIAQFRTAKRRRATHSRCLSFARVTALSWTAWMADALTIAFGARSGKTIII
eukprot:scaffold10163_cov35-Tisochrysis_lutea.AAC.6